mmetsp:Transcript_33988/g.30768  ORF Transcript_33988/g.30768 Transcript_33988/m.30768 type:complete len:107 (-) Transcript_33988:5555-5875(-)
MNNQVLYGIAHIFSSFSDKEKVDNKNYWLYKFFVNRAVAFDHPTLESIYTEAVNVLQVMNQIRLNFQIMCTLRLYKIIFNNNIKIEFDLLNKLFFDRLFRKYGLGD